MKKLSHHYVEAKFVACFLEFYKISNDHIKFKTDGSIGNTNLVQLIEKIYTEFIRSGQDYDRWFDRQVIECPLTLNKTKAKVPPIKINGHPLFIASFSPRKSNKSFYYPISDSSFYSDQPVPINLATMLSYHNLIGPTVLNTTNCPSCVNLYIYRDGKVINDSTCPGISKSAKLEIAFEQTEYYWVLGQKPKFFKCTKHPGECSLLFKRKEHRERHEKICRIDTVVTSKQVYCYS